MPIRYQGGDVQQIRYLGADVTSVFYPLTTGESDNPGDPADTFGMATAPNMAPAAPTLSFVTGSASVSSGTSITLRATTSDMDHGATETFRYQWATDAGFTNIVRDEMVVGYTDDFSVSMSPPSTSVQAEYFCRVTDPGGASNDSTGQTVTWSNPTFVLSTAGISFSVSRAGTVSLGISQGSFSGTNYSNGQNLGRVGSSRTLTLTGSVIVPTTGYDNPGASITITGISATQSRTTYSGAFSYPGITGTSRSGGSTSYFITYPGGNVTTGNFTLNADAGRQFADGRTSVTLSYTVSRTSSGTVTVPVATLLNDATGGTGTSAITYSGTVTFTGVTLASGAGFSGNPNGSWSGIAGSAQSHTSAVIAPQASRQIDSITVDSVTGFGNASVNANNTVTWSGTAPAANTNVVVDLTVNTSSTFVATGELLNADTEDNSAITFAAGGSGFLYVRNTNAAYTVSISGTGRIDGATSQTGGITNEDEYEITGTAGSGTITLVVGGQTTDTQSYTIT